MVFSITAPHIDEQTERQELAALSHQERRTLRDQLHGEFELDESQEDVEQVVSHFEAAMGQIPDNEKTAYLEAMERVPGLVEQESKPLAFMRSVNFDAKAAACRLVEYWKMRYSLFGEAKAFLPMSTEGAMADDVHALRLGVLYPLPDDENGRPVLFWDRVRSYPTISRETTLRIFFYVGQIVCEREAAQTRGVVYIANVKGYGMYRHYDRILTLQASRIMRNCLPFTVCGAHLCSGPGQSVIKLILPVIKHIAGKHLRMHIVLHAGSDKEILDRLEMYGMVRKNITHIFGGGFNRSDFESWLATRMEGERQLT